MEMLVLSVSAYLLGSIPFGLLFARVMGLGDIRAYGSGNIGATNAMRVGGKLLGALTLLADAAKGAAAVLLAKWLDANELFTVLSMLLAVVGHMFPIWLYGKGGKGVATGLGALAILSPLVAMVTALLWIIVFYYSRLSSLASLVAVVVGTFAAYGFLNLAPASAFLLLVVALLIIYKHKANISRLLKGKELKL